MGLDKISNKLNIKDFRRFRWFFWILILSLLFLGYIFLNQEKFFYSSDINGDHYLYRFLWVLPFSFIGFASLILMAAKNGRVKDDAPWSSYVFSYFLRLIAFSLIIFSVLHIFESTSNYLYYFFSAGLGLYVGYKIDAIKLEDINKPK
ncbi:MAG: hypothetical protein ABSE68_00050 [Minisyncoccia bacterium]